MAEAEMSGWRSWINVAEEVQLEVCRDLGIPAEIGIPLMRGVDQNDRVLSELSMYRRHTRIGPCLVKEGSIMPDILVRRVMSEKIKKVVTLDDKAENVWTPQPGIDVDLIVSGSMT